MRIKTFTNLPYSFSHGSFHKYIVTSAKILN